MHVAAAALTAALFAAMVNPAQAVGATPTEPDRVLPPNVAERLEKTFAPLAPAIELRTAACESSRIRATLCASTPSGEHCADATLTDPRAGCRGTESGPWCVEFSSPPPSEFPVAAILTTLATMANPAPWIDPFVAPAIRGRHHPRELTRHAGRLGLALALCPVLAGLLAGLLLRRRRLGLRLVAGGTLAALPHAATWLLVPSFPGVSPWDPAFSSLLFSTALLVGSSLPRGTRFRPASLALLLGITVGAALLESGARILAGPPPDARPLSETQSAANPRELEGVCRVLFPEGDSLWGFDQETITTYEHVVLHVGDSMTGGSWVDPASRFADLLDDPAAGPRHFALAVGGAGVDAYVRFVSRWKRPNVAAVVVHLFPGNDLLDIDRPLVCCDDGPLYRWEGATPYDRCPTPTWRFDRWTLFARAPAPLPLRLLARTSSAAVEAVRLLDSFRVALMPRWTPGEGIEGEYEGTPEAWERFHVLMAMLRDDLARDGIPLLVVVLPFRKALEDPAPTTTPAWRVRGRMLAEFAALRIEALDAWPPFLERVQDGPMTEWFIARPRGDCHFNERGHALYAYWLRDRLNAFLKPTRRPSPSSPSPRPTWPAGRSRRPARRRRAG